MEFTGDRGALSKALTLVLGCASRRGAARVHFHRSRDGGAVLLYGEEGLYLRLPLPGDLRGRGDLSVSAASLQRGLRRLKSTGVTITAHAGVQPGITLDGLPLHPLLTGVLIPMFPRFRALGTVHIPVDDFRRMLREVVASIADDDSRAGMNGVHLEHTDGRLRMVSTNGHRLAWSEGSVQGALVLPPDTLLPRRAIRLLHKLIPASLPGTIRLELSQSSLRIFAGAAVVVIALTSGRFPDYRRIMPLDQRTLTVDAAPLRAAVRRLHPTTGRLILHAAPGQLTLSAEDDSGTGDLEQLDADLMGAPLTLSLNRSYLLDVLRASYPAPPGTRLTFSLGGPLDPCTVSVEGRRDCQFMIMPMRLPEHLQRSA